LTPEGAQEFVADALLSPFEGGFDVADLSFIPRDSPAFGHSDWNYWGDVTILCIAKKPSGRVKSGPVIWPDAYLGVLADIWVFKNWINEKRPGFHGKTARYRA